MNMIKHEFLKNAFNDANEIIDLKQNIFLYFNYTQNTKV